VTHPFFQSIASLLTMCPGRSVSLRIDVAKRETDRSKRLAR
jgi:hypothetical protein